MRIRAIFAEQARVSEKMPLLRITPRASLLMAKRAPHQFAQWRSEKNVNRSPKPVRRNSQAEQPTQNPMIPSPLKTAPVSGRLIGRLTIFEFLEFLSV